MNLLTIAMNVVDVAANGQAIAYAQRDTKADGSVFASFYLCDWGSLQCRPITEGAFLQLKYGEIGGYVAESLVEYFTCRAARLPDGGCAVLRADSVLRLFRPDGRVGASFELEYQGCDAYDIACDGTDLWFTVPARGALVRFSLQERDMVMRVGGHGVFPRATGVTRAQNALWVCCVHEVKSLLLPDLELGERIYLGDLLEKFFVVFGRRFVWMGGTLYACDDDDVGEGKALV